MAFSDNKLINSFLEHDSRELLKIYRECYPMVEKMILNTGGFTDQAEDIFQEAMIIVYRKIITGKFELTCKFSTYIYAICKKIWIQEKRKSKRKVTSIEDTIDIVEEPGYSEPDDQVLNEIVGKHFNELSKDCQKILKMHFNKVNISDIQKVMGYDSSHYAMDRKYRCKKSLIKRIINDPKFKSIKNDYSGEIRTLH